MLENIGPILLEQPGHVGKGKLDGLVVKPYVEACQAVFGLIDEKL
jgi:hypothetical protein